MYAGPANYKHFGLNSVVLYWRYTVKWGKPVRNGVMGGSRKAIFMSASVPACFSHLPHPLSSVLRDGPLVVLEDDIHELPAGSEGGPSSNHRLVQ